MKILCNSYAPMEVKSFLLIKCEFIIFHSLLTFHPLSSGNIFHSCEILNILLHYWPLKLFEILTISNNIIIKYLFKYAVLSRVHQWKFGEFLLNLLCYNNNTGNNKLQENINKYKKILINDMLNKWNFLQNIINVATNPLIYGNDISYNYCLFLKNMLKRCALIRQTINLFKINNKNMLKIIIESFLKNLLNKKINKWHRIHCAKILKETIKFLSKPTILTSINVPKSQAAINLSSENALYSMFDETLLKLGENIPLIINEIFNLDNLDSIKIIKSQNRLIRNPLGLHKLHCLELLMLYINLNKFKLENLGIENMNYLSSQLLNLVFIHNNNNIFLSIFRKFIGILQVHTPNDLEYIFLKCYMMDKFVEYYNNNNTIRTTLHSYILQILWDIYEYHKDLKMINDEEYEMQMEMIKEQMEQKKQNNDENNDNEKDSNDKPDTNNDNDLFADDKKIEIEMPEKEWNFVDYVESNEVYTTFMEMVEEQMEIQEDTDDI